MSAAKKTGAKYLVHLARDVRTKGAKRPVWADAIVLTPTMEEAQEVPREKRWTSRGFQLMGIYELSQRVLGTDRLPQSGTYEFASWLYILSLDKSSPDVV